MNQEKIKMAEEFARQKHQGQKRRDGADYIVHPIRISQTLKGMGASEEMIIAGLLHDTLEDTDTSEGEIKQKFGEKVLQLVKELTHNEEEIKKMGIFEYTKKEAETMSDEALTIHLADVLDNSSKGIRYMSNYRKGYRRVVSNLHKKRELDEGQKFLIKQIMGATDDSRN